jgi:hypothetical protein
VEDAVMTLPKHMTQPHVEITAHTEGIEPTRINTCNASQSGRTHACHTVSPSAQRNPTDATIIPILITGRIACPSGPNPLRRVAGLRQTEARSLAVRSTLFVGLAVLAPFPPEHQLATPAEHNSAPAHRAGGTRRPRN